MMFGGSSMAMGWSGNLGNLPWIDMLEDGGQLFCCVFFFGTSIDMIWVFP